jgi:hypothetical protein
MKKVIQATSKTTAVTLNWYNGQVQTVALTDAADTGFVFTINNVKARPNCQIMLTPVYSGNGEPVVRLVSQAKGSFVVSVKNTGTVALNAAVAINFRIYYS